MIQPKVYILDNAYILGMIELYKQEYNSKQLRDIESLKADIIEQNFNLLINELIEKGKLSKSDKQYKEKVKELRNQKLLYSLDLEQELKIYESLWPDNKYRPIWQPNKL